MTRLGIIAQQQAFDLSDEGINEISEWLGDTAKGARVGTKAILRTRLPVSPPS